MGHTINAIRIGSTPPLYQTSYFSSPLLSKINWAFGFYITAAASYFLYNLYQAFQLRQHTALALDDRFKLAKCQALYAKAQEKAFADAQPLLQQCEDLLASITNTTRSNDKEELLVKLAQSYAQDNPDRFYQMALRFSDSYSIITAALSLQEKHQDFDANKLDALFVQAFDIKSKEDQRPNPYHFCNPSLELIKLLKFAKAFHSVNNQPFADKCMTKALEIANGHEKESARVRALCQIAQCSQELKNPVQATLRIESAQKLLDDIVGTEAIEARLSLANTFFSIGNVDAMDQKLDEVLSLMKKNDPLTTAKSLYPLAKLIDKINKNDQVQSTYKNFAVETLVLNSLEAIEKTNGNRAEVCLTIASIYQDELLNDTATKERALELVFEETRNLPEDTIEAIKSKVPFLELLSYYYEKDGAIMLKIGQSLESHKERALKSAFEMTKHLPDDTDEAIKSKVHLLELLSYYYEKDGAIMLKIGQSLESFYDRYPDDFDCNSGLLMKKPGFGMTILRVYNKAGLEEQSNLFFQKKYLLDLQKPKDVFNKISRLVTYASDHLTRKQIKDQLEAAEALLPQTDSSISYKYTLSLIIKGYSQIDPQKSVELLENHENQQAKWCMIHGTAIPILVGICHYYPTAGLPLSVAYAVVRLWQGSLI